MGREIRRVPLDFAWPLNKVWEGFVNPHGGPCPAEAHGECFCGVTAGRRYVSAIAQILSVAGGDAASGPRKNGIWPHPYIAELPMAPSYKHRAVGPSADLAVLTTALAGREPSFMGHDACDRWSIEKRIIETAGLDPETWGICPVCEGNGDDPAQRASVEAWTETPPPSGDAWQLWETTSEGSPISPPMPTPEELARWLADNGASSFGSNTESYETWLAFIHGPGWAPSAVSSGGLMVSGVAGLSALPIGGASAKALVR